MADTQELIDLMRSLHAALRERVFVACAERSSAELSSVAADGPGDTIFAIDKVGEDLLVELLEQRASEVGGIVLVAEGIHGHELELGVSGRQAAWRLICDPIDGTRGLMYQKRSAWILSAVAPNRGRETRLSDVTCCAQTEIPLIKQHLSDELWATRGKGAQAQRYDRLTRRAQPIEVRPSGATSIEQGYAMLTRFFPGARDELATIDEELIRRVLGPPIEGKAACFEDQYASTGGQLYELCSGRDRFNADLRPLMRATLAARGFSMGICCHPYDICTALIADELGVILTGPDGAALDAPLDTVADVAWIGYANAAIRAQLEAPLLAILRARDLLPAR
jgi:fructose-1,6-bisphosphatase/inositol monophosphatase family enzyme